MARAFADSSVRPPHSVFFASVTAEEQEQFAEASEDAWNRVLEFVARYS